MRTQIIDYIDGCGFVNLMKVNRYHV